MFACVFSRFRKLLSQNSVCIIVLIVETDLLDFGSKEIQLIAHKIQSIEGKQLDVYPIDCQFLTRQYVLCNSFGKFENFNKFVFIIKTIIRHCSVTTIFETD